MKRILTRTGLLLSLIFLTSCGNEYSAADCKGVSTVVADFGICIPDGYKHIVQQFGEGESIVILYMNNETNAVDLRFHIKQDPVKEPVGNNMEFSERAVALARETAPNYKAIRTDPIEISRKQTILHEFEATPPEAEEPIHYHQFVLAYDAIAYGFTGVIDQSIPEINQKVLLQSMRSVQF